MKLIIDNSDDTVTKTMLDLLRDRHDPEEETLVFHYTHKRGFQEVEKITLESPNLERIGGIYEEGYSDSTSEFYLWHNVGILRHTQNEYIPSDSLALFLHYSQTAEALGLVPRGLVLDTYA